MIHIVICDNNVTFLNTLSQYFDKYKSEHKTYLKLTLFKKGEDLINNYCFAFNIIFLDILIPDMDGITVAKKIRELDSRVVMIFLTSTLKYSLMGYSVGAANYMMKPISYKKFKMELDKAISYCNEPEQHFIIIKNATGIYKIYVNDISFIETCNHRTLIHTKKKNITCFHNMKKLEKDLQDFGFIRCHSSYIVNISYIESVEKLLITLLSSEQIPISQQKRKHVMKTLAIYLGWN